MITPCPAVGHHRGKAQPASPLSPWAPPPLLPQRLYCLVRPGGAPPYMATADWVALCTPWGMSSSAGATILLASRAMVPWMCCAFRPASSYCSVCVPASIHWSGITIGRTLHFPLSSKPSRAMKCSTWSPNPPIMFSSTVISASWSRASSRMSSVSSGFMKRASATVTPTSAYSASAPLAASTEAIRRVPRLSTATLVRAPARAGLITRPLPMGTALPPPAPGSSVRP
mmetsp:Transcript_2533/g.3413  ORF Transcript_2533/g.3413 Transcript_2533/m.3413 type:complete len:228 (-) Transcript_2533:1876-2559(-)